MRYENRDITTVQRGIIAHGVNCQGEINTGVAKALRVKWPVIFQSYMACVPRSGLLGHHVLTPVGQDLYVANCFTQDQFGYDGARYADPQAIYNALMSVGYDARRLRLPIYIPKIGCARGGLDWKTEVQPLIAGLEARRGYGVSWEQEIESRLRGDYLPAEYVVCEFTE